MALVQSLVRGKEDAVAFREVDVYKDPDTAGRYGIQATPTVVVLDAAGNEVDTFVGVPEEDGLREAIDKAVSP